MKADKADSRCSGKTNKVVFPPIVQSVQPTVNTRSEPALSNVELPPLKGSTSTSDKAPCVNGYAVSNAHELPKENGTLNKNSITRTNEHNTCSDGKAQTKHAFQNRSRLFNKNVASVRPTAPSNEIATNENKLPNVNGTRNATHVSEGHPLSSLDSQIHDGNLLRKAVIHRREQKRIISEMLLNNDDESTSRTKRAIKSSKNRRRKQKQKATNIVEEQNAALSQTARDDDEYFKQINTKFQGVLKTTTARKSSKTNLVTEQPEINYKEIASTTCSESEPSQDAQILKINDECEDVCDIYSNASKEKQMHVSKSSSHDTSLGFSDNQSNAGSPTYEQEGRDINNELEIANDASNSDAFETGEDNEETSPATESQDCFEYSTEPIEALDQAMERIKDKTWDIKCAAINQIRQLVLDYPSCFAEGNTGVHSVVVTMCEEIMNIRSQVYHSAIVCIGTMLHSKLTKALERDLELIAQLLLHKAVDFKEFIRKDVDKALQNMLDFSDSQKVITALVSGGATSKVPEIRARTAQYLSKLISQFNLKLLLGGNKSLTEMFLPVVDSFLFDSTSPDVRSYGMDMMLLLSAQDNFEAELSRCLDPKQVTSIQQKLNQKKKNSGSSDIAAVTPRSSSKESARSHSSSGHQRRNSFGDKSSNDPEAQSSLEPFKDPQMALIQAMVDISDADWEKQQYAINSIRRLVVHHSDCLVDGTNNFQAVVVALSDTTTSLRSHISRLAIICLGEMFESSLKKAMEPELQIVLKRVLHKAGQCLGFLRGDMDKTINCLVSQCNPQKVLMALISAGGDDRNPAVRTAVARWMVPVVQKLGAKRLLTGNEHVTTTCLTTAAKFLLDSSSETRHHAAEIFTFLLPLAEFKSALKEYLPEKDFENIQDKLRTLKKKLKHSSQSRGRKSSKHSRTDVTAKYEDIGESNAANTKEDPIERCIKLMTDFDWRKRCNGIVEMSKMVMLNPSIVGKHSKIFDTFVPCLRDRNLKVNLLALQVVAEIAPQLGQSLHKVIAFAVEMIAANLACKQREIRNAAIRALDVFMDNLDHSLIFRSICHQAIRAPSYNQPDMIDRVAMMVSQRPGPKCALVHVLPLLVQLLSRPFHMTSPIDPRSVLYSTVQLVQCLYAKYGDRLFKETYKNSNFTPQMKQIMSRMIDIKL